MNKQEYYIDLIYKDLESSLAAAERVELDVWLALSPDNIAMQKQIAEVWAMESTYDGVFPVDTDKAFRSVQDKIQDQKVKPISISKKPIAWGRWAAAASVALLLSVGLRFLIKGSEPEWQTQIASTNAKHITLHDKSQVWLEPGSSLKFPSQFSNSDRQVKLQGRAFFNVAKDMDRPFKISTASCDVEVLGTQFEVWERSGQVQTEVVVKSGKVSVANRRDKEVILTAGQGVICNDQTKKMTMLAVPIDNIDSRKSKRLIYNSTPLSDAIISISRYYDVDIQSEVPLPAHCILNATFVDEHLGSVLNHIRSTLNVEIREVDSTHHLITKTACE